VGVTLSVLTHQKTKNECPIAILERAYHRHPRTLLQQQQSLKRNFNPRLAGVMLLTWRSSTKVAGLAHRGLTLPSRGYCWRASLRTIAEGTHNDPYNSGFQSHNTLVYAKETPVVFCRELKVYEASMPRLGRTGSREACTTGRAEVKVRRRHADR
jgi:hypothetical protein